MFLKESMEKRKWRGASGALEHRQILFLNDSIKKNTVAATIAIEINQKVMPTGSFGSKFPPAANAIDGIRIASDAIATDFKDLIIDIGHSPNVAF